MTHVSAYPLTWPDTLPRSAKKHSAQFRTSLNGAMANVNDSLRRFSSDSSRAISDLVISSNVTLGVNRPDDPGVAVWFKWDGMQVCIAVDRYPKVEHNLQAIHHIIEARRTEIRHGGIEITRATFRGFQALPAPEGSGRRGWREVLQVPPGTTADRKDIETLYRNLAKKAHPDTGGSAAQMAELNRAREEALEEVGL